MSRMPFLLLLGFRSPVHGLLGVAGRIGLIAGLVCGVLAMSGDGLMYLAIAVCGFAVWYASMALRWGYDTTVLRNVPEGENVHLF